MLSNVNRAKQPGGNGLSCLLIQQLNGVVKSFCFNLVAIGLN